MSGNLAFDLDAATDRFYEAALVPELWPEALSTLCGLFGSNTGALVVINADFRARGVASLEANEALQQFLATPGTERSPRTTAAMAAPPGSFVRVNDLLSPAEIEADPMEQAMRRNGLGCQVFTMIPMPSGDVATLSFERRLGDGTHAQTDVDRLNAARPHMARAAVLAARLGTERARAMTATLDAVGLPAAALAADGRVVHANGAFEQVGALRPAAFGKLAIDAPEAQALFVQALQEARAEAVPTVRSIAVPAMQGFSPAVLHLVPIRGAAHDVFARTTFLLIVTSFGHGTAAPSLPLLHGLFDLTPKEAALAAALSSGKTLKEAAALNGMQYSTARTHLEHIFRKTGVRQQTQLVLLLQGALPLVPPVGKLSL